MVGHFAIHYTILTIMFLKIGRILLYMYVRMRELRRKKKGEYIAYVNH